MRRSDITLSNIRIAAYITRYVSYKDIKAFVADLKLIYTALTEEYALEALRALKKKWGEKYPSGVRSWEENWDILSTF